MSPNSYVADLRAERDALRAVVARVEELAAEMESVPRGEVMPVSGAAHLLRTALGSTDSDPASTERQGEAEGAGDGV